MRAGANAVARERCSTRAQRVSRQRLRLPDRLCRPPKTTAGIKTDTQAQYSTAAHAQPSAIRKSAA
jgi:hypothetical protein